MKEVRIQNRTISSLFNFLVSIYDFCYIGENNMFCNLDHRGGGLFSPSLLAVSPLSMLTDAPVSHRA